MNRKTIALLVFSLALCASFFVLVGVMMYKSDTKNQTAAESKTEQSSAADNSVPDQSENSDNKTAEACNTSAITKAYLSGDPDTLSELERKVYDKACEIIESSISPDMTDFQKELAVHDWLILNCSYDEKALGVFKSHSEHSDDPYGALINGTAICKGYTSSFQLLMDMLEIPCKTISAEDEDGDEHAWNLVCIEEEWYYVDVTWDDPVPDYDGRGAVHKYFNVTSSFMEQTGHVWDNSDLPAADSLKFTYVNQTAVSVSDLDGLKNAVSRCAENKTSDLYVLFDDNSVILPKKIGDSFSPDRRSALNVKYLAPLEKALGDYYFRYSIAETEKGVCLAIHFD